jgi:outer membrane lipoprotein
LYSKPRRKAITQFLTQCKNHRSTAMPTARIPSLSNWRRRAAGLLGALAALTLAACAAVPPEPLPARIVQPPTGDLQLAEVRGDIARFLGAPVRWGGTVIAVDRDSAGNARVQVVERRLDGEGRPIPGSASDGRFLIAAAPEVQPELYRRGAEITVAGSVSEAQQVHIGERTVSVPRVQVDVFQRWEPVWRGYPYDDPFYHPWYGPPWYGSRMHFGVGHGWYRGHGPPPWWW